METIEWLSQFFPVISESFSTIVEIWCCRHIERRRVWVILDDTNYLKFQERTRWFRVILVISSEFDTFKPILGDFSWFQLWFPLQWIWDVHYYDRDKGDNKSQSNILNRKRRIHLIYKYLSALIGRPSAWIPQTTSDWRSITFHCNKSNNKLAINIYSK